ncbi:hypothetical protein [Fusobacterium sp. PH5-44]|uniref:hypothetical protein n=1 Tax=unclassified Fusobacterium TaxID=2648384 RepID=UPI003D1F1D2C
MKKIIDFLINTSNNAYLKAAKISSFILCVLITIYLFSRNTKIFPLVCTNIFLFNFFIKLIIYTKNGIFRIIKRQSLCPTSIVEHRYYIDYTVEVAIRTSVAKQDEKKKMIALEKIRESQEKIEELKEKLYFLTDENEKKELRKKILYIKKQSRKEGMGWSFGERTQYERMLYHANSIKEKEQLKKLIYKIEEISQEYFSNNS